jgi:hypothetical protein
MRALRILAQIAALAAVLAAAAGPAAAAETEASPEALAAARELFAITFERAGVQLNAQAVDHTWPSVEKALRGRNPGLDAATLGGLRQEFERIRLQKVRELMKDTPAIYVRHLTPDDMRAIAAFYKSPTGTRMLQAVPSIVGEIFAIALPGMPGVIGDTHETFLALVRERGLIK